MTPAVVRAAADRVIEALAGDDAFREYMTRTVIDQRIAEGELIPCDQLRTGGHLVIVTADRLLELTTAVNDALGALAAPKPNVTAARRSLEAVGEPAAKPARRKRATKASKSAAVEPAPAKPVVVPDPPAEDERPAGMPAGMPNADETYQCEQCGTNIAGHEAQLPWIRLRRILCRRDFIDATPNVG